MEHEHIDSPIKDTQISWPTGKPPGEVEEHSGLDVLNHLLEDSKMETTQQPKRQPTNLFDSKEQYLAFRAQWSKLAAGKKLTSSMMVFYNLARGKDSFRGFVAITSAVKLANGAKADYGYTSALASVVYLALPKNSFAEKERADFIAMFDGTINDEFMAKMANYLPI